MTNWYPENPGEKRNKIILFLVSPVLGFLYSLKSMNTKSTYRIFFFFALCFGMAFSTESYDWVSATLSGIDAGRYRQSFEEFAKMTSVEFIQRADHYVEFDDGDKDFYFIAASYIVSRFTDNYHFLFLLFAAVFAFFQLKTLKYLTQHECYENSLFFLIIAFLFTWNQIFNINAMRFYTAAWIGVYTILKIFLDGDKRFFLLLLITPFFHHSFWLFLVVVLLAYLFKRFEVFWIVMFVISFFGSTFLSDVITYAADYLPDTFAQMATYADSDNLFVESTFTGSGFYWVPMVFDRMYKIYTNLLVVLLIFQRNNLKVGLEKNLYLFIIIFMTYINFAMPIPALGRRSIVMAYPIIAYLWMISYGKEKFQWIIYIMPFVWAWQIMTYAGYYTTVLNLDFILSPIYLVFKYLLLA